MEVIHQNVGAGAAAVGTNLPVSRRGRVTHIGYARSEVHQVKRISVYQSRSLMACGRSPSVTASSVSMVLRLALTSTLCVPPAISASGWRRVLGDVQLMCVRTVFLKTLDLRRYRVKPGGSKQKVASVLSDVAVNLYPFCVARTPWRLAPLHAGSVNNPLQFRSSPGRTSQLEQDDDGDVRV